MESEQRGGWDRDVTARKLGSTTVGSKSEMTASPLVGPERKKSSTVPSVSKSSYLLSSGVVICCENFLLKRFSKTFISFLKKFQNFKANHTFKEHTKGAKLLISAI